MPRSKVRPGHVSDIINPDLAGQPDINSVLKSPNLRFDHSDLLRTDSSVMGFCFFLNS